MLCLHDIRLEYNDYVAQFDFIIITNKFIYLLETKKLNGDIEITKDGDFIRNIKNYSGKVIKREGMYSPISQNERHVNILKEVLVKEKLIKTIPVKSAVVLANPKSIVNKTKCPKSISNNICKYDQLTRLLKDAINDKSNEKDMLEKYIYEISDYLLENNKPITFDYITKYSLNETSFITIGETTKSINELFVEKVVQPVSVPIENTSTKNFSQGSDLYEALRQFRLTKSRKEGIKPYFVFTNKELEDILEAMPKNKEDCIHLAI
jgi:superfamily II DNA helicase RecQ